MIKRLIVGYLALVGILVHLAWFSLAIFKPAFLEKATNKAYEQLVDAQSEFEVNQIITFDSVEEEIAAVFYPWEPLSDYSATSTTMLNGVAQPSLKIALENLDDGDVLEIAEGVYKDPIKITKNDITIIGRGHVIFEKGAYRGKAFIVNQGHNVTIKNIECRNINVGDRNGACIRQEGKNLSLEHVYFHNSQSGILEMGNQDSTIRVSDSRFEQLGKGGRAHGIYSNGANLIIDNTLFIGTKDGAHSVKSRSSNTAIKDSVITSFSAEDSRAVDISNGGILVIEDSILAKGPLSTNGQMIGYGLEGMRHSDNRVLLGGNLFLHERVGYNELLASKGDDFTKELSANVIVGKNVRVKPETAGRVFEKRSLANLPEYPYLPKFQCKGKQSCSIRSPEE